MQSDGGGKVIAFRNPIVGLDRVLRLYAGLHRKLIDRPPALVAPTWIDGLPGYVSRERDGVLQTTALAIEDGRITAHLHHPQPGQAARHRARDGRARVDAAAALRAGQGPAGRFAPAGTATGLGEGPLVRLGLSLPGLSAPPFFRWNLSL